MILPASTRPKRESRRRRQSRWHSVFVIYRRFHCRRSNISVLAVLETVERRRDPGCDWLYRTKGTR